MQNRWTPFQSFLENKQNILITTHLNPDGDALGSEIALALFLQEIGKDVRIINSDPTPAFFDFLQVDSFIEQYDPARYDGLLPSFDACVIVDVSEFQRLGAIQQVIERATFPLACIDHHISTNEIGQVNIVDSTCSSTGELVYDLLVQSGATFSQLVVDALYTCILTDTGSFHFSNTTSRSHRIIADLIDKGAHFETIYSSLYESDSKERLLLKGYMLSNMHFEYDDRFAWFVLSQDVLKKIGAEMWEAEGFSELPRTVKSVEISIMFSETEDGLAKASFRSKGKIPVNDLAREFGGGGHMYAAGAALSMPLDEAIPLLRKAAKAHLQKYRDIISDTI